MIPHKQLSLADIFSDCQEKFENDKPAFLSLLETYIDINEFIPISFRNHFYASTGRTRKYPLQAFLWALIIQRIFSIPTDQLLLTFLAYSKPLREFCGFTKVPDASKITRFKQEFLDDLQFVFDNLVDVTEPICQAIDSAKAPGFDKSYDPYKAAYGSMPTHASANPEIKQLYINGHFCYVFKFGIVTNGLGIIRHISFYNKDFMASHPDIVVEKKSDSPDEDKSVHDSKLLVPTLKDFFSKHPLINPKTFLGDAAFDTVELYKSLLTGDTFGDDKHFSKAYIPLNARSGLENQDYTINENGIPCCPNDPSLPMKPESSKSNLRSGIPTFKFVCPKMKWVYDKTTKKAHRQCFCESPCTSSKCGRMVYIYPEKDLRAYPGTIRGTEEWDNTYKIRTVVERDINHIKDNLCLAGRRTQNEKTLHADLILAGITQLITVVLADKINHHEYIRSLKPLIA